MGRIKVLWAAFVAGLAGSAAMAATVVISVTDSDGAPVSDAVVRLAPGGAGTTPRATPHIIDQRNETFVPLVDIVLPGDPIVFRNSDQTRHHVYSFSSLGHFDFPVKPGESSSPLLLEKPPAGWGVIAVGCNIHDNMIAYLYISDTPTAGLSNQAGNAEIKDVPHGAYVVHLWHPRLRPGHPEVEQALTVAGDSATASVSLSLLPARSPVSGDSRY
jgi:plastocyanin